MAGTDALGRTVPSTRKLRNNFPSLSGACILEGGWGQSHIAAPEGRVAELFRR